MSQSLLGASTVSSTVAATRQWLVARLAAVLELDPREIERDAQLARHGISSLQALAIMHDLGALVGRKLSVTAPWEHPTIDALARYAVGPTISSAPAPRPAPGHDGSDEPLAIVGMACRFAAAPDLQAFWRVLAEGIDATGDVPPERWDADAYDRDDRDAPGERVRRRAALIEQVDRFDPLAFGISPREAHEIDPAQRLALELSWEALEHAGIPLASLQGSATGVFFGAVCSLAGLPRRSPQPTLFLRCTDPVPGIEHERASGCSDWRARGPHAHARIDVPGNHFSVLMEHASPTGQVILDWIAGLPAEDRGAPAGRTAKTRSP